MRDEPEFRPGAFLRLESASPVSASPRLRAEKTSHNPKTSNGIKRPVLMNQNHKTLCSPLLQPKFQPMNLLVSLALPASDHASSGTATTAAPTAKVIHSVHLAGFRAKMKTPTTNSTNRLCKCTRGSR